MVEVVLIEEIVTWALLSLKKAIAGNCWHEMEAIFGRVLQGMINRLCIGWLRHC